VIEKDGLLTHIDIAQGVHEILDKEALRVVRSMPKWLPGMRDGKPARQRMIIPIDVRLR
jgi:hypothetical protein